LNYTSELTLDIAAVDLACEIPVVRVKQGDAYSRFITATLKSDGEPYIPESGVVFRLRCRKPDGTCIFEDSSMEDEILGRYLVIDNGDGTISVEIVPDVIDKTGVCWCDLSMHKNEQILSTMRFAIHVFASPDINMSGYMPPAHSTGEHTCTILNNGTPLNVIVFNNVQYYNTGSFVFKSGDTATLYAHGQSGSGEILIDGTRVSYNQSATAQYDYTLPDHDILVSFDYSCATAYTEITYPTILITENDKVVVDSYYYADINVPPGLMQAKTHITPLESSQTVEPDSDYDGLSSVQIDAIPTSYVGSGISRRSSADLTSSGDTVTVPIGYYSAWASKSVDRGSVTLPATSITTIPTISVNSSTGIISASVSASSTVSPVVNAGYVSSVSNGTVSVSGSNTAALSIQTAKTITPSTSQQTAVAAGKYTTGAVMVAAMPEGSAGIPVATKSSVSSHSVSVTPSVTNTTGYITGGTKTGTAVTVTAAELVSGTKSITSNGTGINVKNYASVDVNIPTGTARTSADVSISGNTATVPAGLYSSDVSISASQLVSGTKSITSNGTGIDVTNYAAVDVDTAPTLQAKTNITPTELSQTVTADQQYDGLSSVQINGISTTYIGSGIDRNNSSDIVMTTNTITVPSGYYANDVTINLPEVSPGGAAITTISDPAGGTVLMIDTDGEITSSPLTVTQNGTYTAEAGTAYSQVMVNVPSGLTYETGTYTPTSDTARPTISYANSHTGWPLYIVMEDVSEGASKASGYNTFWSITYFENPLTYISPSSSSTRYGIVNYQYYSGNSPNFTTTEGTYNLTTSASSDGNSGTGNTGYWITSTGFKPGSGSASRYWKAGCQYKWIAVWPPQATL